MDPQSTLRIVLPTCCGIDVHKTFVVATIAALDKRGKSTYQHKRFSTSTACLRELAQWLISNKCTEVCMESTGKYWIPVYNILESSCRIVLVHPKYVKTIRGKKTDVKDSAWIADLRRYDLVSGSFIPPADIRDLRDLIRYRSKLVSITSSEKTRVQDSLVVSNITLSSVVSDIFGKSSSALLSHLLDHPDDRGFDVRRFLYRSMLGKADQIALALDGTINPTQAKRISWCRQHVDELASRIHQIEELAHNLAAPYSRQLQIIQSVPGIGAFASVAILSEIGADMAQFPSSKKLCSWAGLAPCSDHSAGKKKSVRISPAGLYLKPILVQCALAAVKDKSFPHIFARYRVLKHRRGHKRAIIAIARNLLAVIYRCLSDNVLYDPSIAAPPKCSDPETIRNIAVSKLFAQAKLLGYSLTYSGT